MTTTRAQPFLSTPFAVIGHRGAAGHAPENSIEAFEIAFAAGVDAIELDVKLIHDELLVFHDDTVERLTNGVGALDALSANEVAQLRLRNGESIPTLADVWDIVPPNIGMNIELKGPHTAVPTVEFIRVHSHHYLVSSFLVDELRAFRELMPHVPTALLTRVRDKTILDIAASLDVANIHVMDAVAERRYIAPMLAAGYAVYVFTVNEVERARELQDLGVAAVFTDVPRVVKTPLD